MIETARLILSAWTEAERAPFAAMCADPEVMHDYPAAPTPRPRPTRGSSAARPPASATASAKWALRLKG